MSIVDKITKGMDDYVLSQQKQRKPYRIGYYYPSELASCYREFYFKRHLVKPLPIEARYRMEVGKILHEHYARPAIEQMFPDARVLRPERDFSIIVDRARKIYVHGRADHLIWLKEGDRRFIVEVKSIANLWAQKGADLWTYEMQTQPAIVGMEADDWYLLFISRAVGSHRTYEFQFDQKLFDEAMDRVCLVHDYFERGEIPPAEGMTNPHFTKTNPKGKKRFWKCGYCSYSPECADVTCSEREAVEKGE